LGSLLTRHDGEETTLTLLQGNMTPTIGTDLPGHTTSTASATAVVTTFFPFTIGCAIPYARAVETKGEGTALATDPAAAIITA
jgi:hypothetical protein